LFNLASGAHEHVGNYSGVTVSAKEGYFNFEGYHFKIVDLPGTNSFLKINPSPYSPNRTSTIPIQNYSDTNKRY
ncbi:hypothetical protein EZS27_044517, partial [termite gut metagenome]